MAKGKKNPVSAEVETEKEVQFTFRGVTYHINREDVDDLELFELIEDNKSITACRQILGPERWKQFKESARGENGRVTMDTMNQFLNELMVGIGKAQRGNS